MSEAEGQIAPVDEASAFFGWEKRVAGEEWIPIDEVRSQKRQDAESASRHAIRHRMWQAQPDLTARTGCRLSITSGNSRVGRIYRDLMLKYFQPFIHVIESAAVPIFAFGPYRQWEACQNEAKGELENNIPGQREHPSEK
jgi:hypothetical protein